MGPLDIPGCFTIIWPDFLGVSSEGSGCWYAPSLHTNSWESKVPPPPPRNKALLRETNG